MWIWPLTSSTSRKLSERMIKKHRKWGFSFKESCKKSTASSKTGIETKEELPIVIFGKYFDFCRCLLHFRFRRKKATTSRENWNGSWHFLFILGEKEIQRFSFNKLAKLSTAGSKKNLNLITNWKFLGKKFNTVILKVWNNLSQTFIPIDVKIFTRK